MENATRSVGANIKRLRKAKGLTADALARSVGITENALRKLEAGDSKEPRFSTGLRLARALDTQPQTILTGHRTKASAAPDLAAVIQQIRRNRSKLEKLGIAHLSIFGSVARGDATAKSDVDVAVEPKSEVTFSLVDLGLVSDSLQEALATRVDVHTLMTIQMARFGERALEEAVLVF